MRYAEWFFQMARRVRGAKGEDLGTERAHLEAAAKSGSVSAKAALREPKVPARFTYLWSWFLELHARRGAGMHGPASLTWPDMDAWARLTQRTPNAWEWRVIAALDDAFFRAVNAGG